MLKADRIGLVVVFASLLAIAALSYVVIRYQHMDVVDDIRKEGVSFVRAVSAVPYEHLMPGGTQQGVLRVLAHGTRNDSFAYVSIVDPDGRSVNEWAADGIIVPPSRFAAEPSAWLGETQHEIAPSGKRILEFHAPLLDAGDLDGFVRLGYRYPALGIDLQKLPFYAAMSLPVFLLVPLFYLLLRLEIRPVRRANAEISRLIDGEPLRKLEVAATGELGDFLLRFNRFIEFAAQRIELLEQEQRQMITSSKLLGYRKNRIETVLETLPEAVLILDESGTITFANQKLAAMFGVSTEVILSQPCGNWCGNADILHLLSKYQSGGTARALTDTVRFKLDSLAGQAIVTKAYPLFAPRDPSVSIGTLVIFRDETQESLARQARADFVAHLSHELKSPLNVLALYSESLLGEPGRKAEFRIEAANVIADEVDRLGKLITGLLSLTQIESGSLTPDKSLVKLRDVASAAFDEAKNSARDRNFRFVFDAPKEVSPVYVDKDLIRIAITNLLSNAVKYNVDGGEVRLTLEETDDALQIRVSDTGIGISDEESARIFEKFYRSEDERVQSVGGHGLGLALARQIVDLHLGSLSLDQDREQGTEFIINLWKETAAVRQAM